jgi:hypothetical protein
VNKIISTIYAQKGTMPQRKSEKTRVIKANENNRKNYQTTGLSQMHLNAPSESHDEKQYVCL